jgi:hypothetical protein
MEVLIMRDKTLVRALIGLVVLGLILFLYGVAEAADMPKGPVAKTQNVNQGHIYLTFEPCEAKVDVPIASPLYRVYAVDFEGTDQERTVEACWVSPEINWDEIPEEHRSRIVRAITILAPYGHETFLWTDFKPVDIPDQ